MRSVAVLNLGLCRYRHAISVQDIVAERLKAKNFYGRDGILILVQHPPVYTVGIRKEALPRGEADKLKGLGADVEYIGRGGLVTFHGPGQMVAWAVLHLKAFWGIKKHIHNLEESVIQTCKKLGLKDVSRNDAYPGVWNGDGKLCAVGVRASRFVTTHGLALNVSTDLSWFEHIVPCGIEDKRVTSLSQELSQNITVEQVTPIFLESFSQVFSCRLTDIPEQ